MEGLNSKNKNILKVVGPLNTNAKIKLKIVIII